MCHKTFWTLMIFVHHVNILFSNNILNYGLNMVVFMRAYESSGTGPSDKGTSPSKEISKI